MSFRFKYSSIQIECSVLMLAIALLSGCEQSKYELVAVSGRVTFDGENCPASGSVTFQPLEIAAGLPKRPATGKFGVDGEYTVNSFSDSEGVMPGRYRVEVTCFAGGPDLSAPDPWAAVDYIAEEYEPTELTIDEDNGSVKYDIDVPRRRKTTQ